MAQQVSTVAGIAAAVLFAFALCVTVLRGLRRLRRGQTDALPPLGLTKGTGILQKDYARILWMLMASTLLIFVIGIAAQMIQAGRWMSLGEAFSRAFQKWDALHYMEIAKNGYAAVGETRYFIVFFPLFPLLVKSIAWLFFYNYVAAACALNFLLMYGALLVMFKLGLMDYSRDQVYTALALLLTFPTAYFWHNAYSEATLLFTGVLSLYFVRTGHYAKAGLAGLLCALSRATGVLCAVPLVAHSFFSAWENGRLNVRQWLRQAKWCMAPLCGFALYLLLNYVVTGDPFMFLTHQREHWYNGMMPFPQTVSMITRYMLVNTQAHLAPHYISSFCALFLFLGVLCVGAFRLKTDLALYSLCYYALMISQKWLLSGPRYLMAMFPAYFVLATLPRTRVGQITLVSLSTLGLCVMTVLFALDYPLY